MHDITSDFLCLTKSYNALIEKHVGYCEAYNLSLISIPTEGISKTMLWNSYRGFVYVGGHKWHGGICRIHRHVCFIKLVLTTWCRHQMETFSALLALCAGNSVTWSLMFSFICAWINGWINNREAGYLRRHWAHYDATVMKKVNLMPSTSKLATVS